MMVKIVANEKIQFNAKVPDGTKSMVFRNNLMFMANDQGVLSYNLIDAKASPAQLKLFTGEFDIFTNHNNQIICRCSNKTTLFVLKPE